MLSLQVFQLCDETHDAWAALSDKVETLSQKNSTVAAPKPVDDPDADLPLVLGQALHHGRVADRADLVPASNSPCAATTGIAFISEVPAPDRAPPWSWFSEIAPPHASLRLALSSVRILAPPLI